MESKRAKVFNVVICGLGWFALIAQLVLHLENGVPSLTESLIRFFSYFTVLTNLLITLYSTILLFATYSSVGKFASQFKTASAITVYIAVVGLVYNVVLRSIWKPQGLQLIVNELLHSVIPVLFVAYWFFGLDRVKLQWRDVWWWLVYPLVYSIFVLVRGSFSGFYPYPFMHVDDLGLNQVLLNSVIVTMVFLFFSFLFVAISRSFKKNLV